MSRIDHSEEPVEDDIAGRIADFSLAVHYDSLPAEVVRALTQKLLDSVACALGAADSVAVRVSRTATQRLCPAGPSSLIGGGSSSADLAAFVNGVAVRYLDLSDVYVGPREAIHPSDCTSAILAVAEAERRSGRDAIAGLAVAYEVLCRIVDTVELGPRGWDGAGLCSIAAAAGVASLLGLDRTRLRQAINLAGADCPALFQTRLGPISMWKAAAGANSARQGVLAAYLAAAGMTGPQPIFEGRAGLRELVSMDLRWPEDRRWRTPQVRLKKYAAQYFSHSAIAAALALREEGLHPESVESVVVHTFVRPGDQSSTPEMWFPRTRETADHSLPYCVAVALLDGRVGPAQFSPGRLRRADVVRLMERIRVREDPAYTRRFPGQMPCRIRVELRGGGSRETEVTVPPGHPERPLTDADVESKLVELASERWRPGELGALAARLRRFAELDDLQGFWHHAPADRP